MKITVEIEFFDLFPPPAVKDLQRYLEEMRTGAFTSGTIELIVSNSKIRKTIKTEHSKDYSKE